MRVLLSMSVVAVVAAGACSQSLTHDMSGAGGTGGISTGMGGEGANTRPAAGGAGGSGGQSACDGLAAQYKMVLRGAQSCTIGSTGQCQQVVDVALSFCGQCQTYVNDATALNAIRQAWEGLNCRNVNPPPQCSLVGCPIPVNNVCTWTADDSSSATGVCSSVPGTGGTSGAGGSGAGGTGGSWVLDGGAVVNCPELSMQYVAALAAAKSCDAGAPNQCAQQVPTQLSACGGCTDFVNDATTLNQIRQAWTQAGCGGELTICPAIACVAGYSSVCVAGDAGGGRCTTSFTTEPLGLQ